MRTGRAFTHPGCGMCDIPTYLRHYEPTPHPLRDRLVEATYLQSKGDWWSHHNRSIRRLGALLEQHRLTRAEHRTAVRRITR